jgi:CHAT domain-containing protein/tetratricopeptide (TPR) repeat protein
LFLLGLVRAFPAVNGAEPADPVIAQALALNRQGGEREAAGDWEGGLRLRQDGLTQLVGRFGLDDVRVDATRVDVASTQLALGRYAAARSNLLQSLAWREARLPARHVRVAQLVNLLGESHRRAGDREAAAENYRRVIRDLADNPEGALVRATSFANLGLVLQQAGDLASAAASLTQARDLQGTNASPLSRAMVLANLASVHRSLGEPLEADREVTAAFNLTSNQPVVVRLQAGIEGEWATVLEAERRFPEALTVRSNVLGWRRRQLGATDLQSLLAQRAWAQSLLQADQPAAALPLLTEGLELAAAHPRDPVRHALALDLGDCRQRLGDFDAAAEAYADVARRVTDTFGANHPLAVGAKLRLAQLARLRGDYATTAGLHAELLTGLRAAPASGAQRRDLAGVLVAEATLRRILGRPDLAEAALGEAVGLLAEAPAEFRLRADALLQQALLVRPQDGRRAAGLRALARSLRLRALGNDSLAVAETYLADAEQLVEERQPAAALVALQAARAIADRLQPPNVQATAMLQFLEGRALAGLGRWGEAAGPLQAAFDTYVALRTRHALISGQELGLVLLRLGRPAEAATLARRTTGLAVSLWSEVTRFGSEDDRLAWRDEVDLFSLPAAVAAVDPGPLTAAILQFKGAVLDSFAAEQWLRARAADPAVARWRQARERRAALEQRAVVAPDSVSPERDAARRELEAAESSLARQSGVGSPAPVVRWEAVRDAVPAGAVLVEFVRFRRPDAGGGLTPAFGAVLLERGASPRWVDLGPAEAIRSRVLALANLMAEPVTPGTTETTRLLGELHRLVWLPVRQALGTTWPRTMVMAPDAELHFLPWALLWADGQFLGEMVSIRQVSSGRDLLRDPLPADRTAPVAVVSVSRFARPDWQRTVTTGVTDALQAAWEAVAGRGIAGADLPDGYPPLAETAAEGRAVAALARAAGYSRTTLLQDGSATEAAVRALGSPHVLHLATHATFLPEPARTSPMNRAWIALWRAGETVADWRTGRFADPAQDGLLTAEELGALDLRQTWLVTLSACDTGRGDQRDGEGVFGLKRALATAGAGQVLLTLWPVHDRETRALMEDFYREALQAHDAGSALFMAQSKALRTLRESAGVGAAAQRAGPFVLTGFTR